MDIELVFTITGVSPGYSKSTSPIQVLPRKASVITRPIRGIAMSVSFFYGVQSCARQLTTNSGLLGYSHDMPFYDWGGCVRMEWWCFEDKVCERV